MTEINTEFKHTRTCKLERIKECSVVFHTNIKSKLFCCDDHRYRWHNNLKSLFGRVTKVEENQEKIISILNDHIGMRIAQNGNITYPVMMKLKRP